MSPVHPVAVTLVGGPCHGEHHDVHIWPYRVDVQYFPVGHAPPVEHPGCYLPDEGDPRFAEWLDEAETVVVA
jgi:hypothetical protein